MKFGCSFSLLILLLISLQSSFIFAVLCPFSNFLGEAKDKLFNTTDTKQCSTCVVYSCKKLKNQTVDIHKGGCPEDFYNDCTDYPDHAEIIKTNGSNNLEYQFDSSKMAYISGCSGYCNGTECIGKKTINFLDDWGNNKLVPDKNGVASRNVEDPKGMGDVCDPVAPNDDKKPSKNTTSASKGQDGTMKNIGIFLIGFIFAAWVY